MDDCDVCQRLRSAMNEEKTKHHTNRIIIEKKVCRENEILLLIIIIIEFIGTYALQTLRCVSFIRTITYWDIE